MQREIQAQPDLKEMLVPLALKESRDLLGTRDPPDRKVFRAFKETPDLLALLEIQAPQALRVKLAQQARRGLSGRRASKEFKVWPATLDLLDLKV